MLWTEKFLQDGAAAVSQSSRHCRNNWELLEGRKDGIWRCSIDFLYVPGGKGRFQLLPEVVAEPGASRTHFSLPFLLLGKHLLPKSCPGTWQGERNSCGRGPMSSPPHVPSNQTGSDPIPTPTFPGIHAMNSICCTVESF